MDRGKTMSAHGWVKERARCTASHYLGEPSKMVRHDIKQFNRLDIARERKSGFSVIGGGSSCSRGSSSGDEPLGWQPG